MLLSGLFFPAEGLEAHFLGGFTNQEKDNRNRDDEENDGQLHKAGTPARGLNGGRDDGGHDRAGKAGACQGDAHGGAALFDEPVGENTRDGHAGQHTGKDALNRGNGIEVVNTGGPGVAEHAGADDAAADDHEGLEAVIFEELTPQGAHEEAAQHGKGVVKREGTASYPQVFAAGDDKNRKGIGDNADSRRLNAQTAQDDDPSVKKFRFTLLHETVSLLI